MATLTERTPGTTGNLFLDSLEPESFAALVAHTQTYEAITGNVASRSREPLRFVVFPITGAISMVMRMNDGSDVEAMLVGREGLFGVHAALGNDVSASEGVAQLPGTFLRIPTSDFIRTVQADAKLQARVLSYAHASLEVVSQFSACNRLHPINERGARWLLMAHDRVSGDTVHITHEYLATMLGVRRPGVSLATAAFDQSGFIESHRGRIIIRDRAGLESAACECYAASNATFERILGYSVRKN
jgi:CRP-like cAMP-binding protein